MLLVLGRLVGSEHGLVLHWRYGWLGWPRWRLPLDDIAANADGSGRRAAGWHQVPGRVSRSFRQPERPGTAVHAQGRPPASSRLARARTAGAVHPAPGCPHGAERPSPERNSAWPAPARRPTCCASSPSCGPIERMAAAELRSANAQVEYLLRGDALAQHRRKPPAPEAPIPGRKAPTRP